MKRYYFTFGSAEHFPYKNSYMVVLVSDHEDREDAINEYRKKYPDIHKDCINCSFIYNEEEWMKLKLQQRSSYSDPVEIIRTDSCYGTKPEGYNDLFVYIPEQGEIIWISEGTGDNLLKEDKGYVDYINYEQYYLKPGMYVADGGMIMYQELVRDHFRCLADCIPDVLDMAYGNEMLNCIILQ